jgi:hypothetical protein
MSRNAARDAMRVSVLDLTEGASKGLQEFRVAEAHCWSAVEEAKIRQIIDAEGRDLFDNIIREVATILSSSSSTVVKACDVFAHLEHSVIRTERIPTGVLVAEVLRRHAGWPTKFLPCTRKWQVRLSGLYVRVCMYVLSVCRAGRS